MPTLLAASGQSDVGDESVLHRVRKAVQASGPDLLQTPRVGRVVQAVGTLIRATGLMASVGELCHLRNLRDGGTRMAEVVGITDEQLLLMPLGPLEGVSSGTQVLGTGKAFSIRVGRHLLGRVIDAIGQPLDGKMIPNDGDERPANADAPDPLSRARIDQPLVMGVKAIDSLLTCGRGQRIGIFAAAGCGKSTLLGMLARNAASDINVIALIGERGREVREFIEDALGAEGLARSVIVSATSDRPAAERARAVFIATAIAEHFRDQGQHVLLLVDSLTRYARAQREIGLAAGEPPTRRAFPPSVFSQLPQIVERAGCARVGSITAFYTVLMEDEDSADPIAEEVRSLLDGHIVLTRKLAAEGQYPAIDVLESVSRIMNMITTQAHQESAAKLRKLLAKYREVELLIKVGEYRAGSDPEVDEAIRKMGAIKQLLRQHTHENVPWAQTLSIMEGLAR